MKKLTLTFIVLTYLLAGCKSGLYQIDKSEVEQVHIPRVETMPNLPQPYEMLDWKQIALEFDALIFDENTSGKYRPFIWMDDSRRNFDQETFGIYTAIGDVRQGPDANIEGHEALGVIGALLGGTLVGIDKSDQNGKNYVKMVKNYFNRDNDWNIIMNFTSDKGHIGGGYGNDWWYDLFNNVLFYALGHHYPQTDDFNDIMYTIAEQVFKADSILGQNYSYSYFDFGKMQPGMNHIPPQEDVAAAHAFILYAAFIKFGEDRFLRGAKNAIQVLSSQKESRFYEILMPFAAYVSARINAEQQDSIDILPFLNWTFDGTATNRVGWGVISDTWGDYDVHGIVGSTIHNGGYGFLMNTFDLAWPLCAMVRYDQRYARAIGKWLLNAANASRLFYPAHIPDTLQAIPHLKSITQGVIAYEGLIKSSTFDKYKGITPFAQGDGPNWYPGMPDETMFSVYGSAHVGIFGTIIEKTNVEGILKINCTATDMFTADKGFNTYLYYNPHPEIKSVTLDLGMEQYDVYDPVKRVFLCRQCSGSQSIEINVDQARMMVIIPTFKRYHVIGNKLYANDVVIDYLYH